MSEAERPKGAQGGMRMLLPLGAQVMTKMGPRPVEKLRVGQRLYTLDQGLVPLGALKITRRAYSGPLGRLRPRPIRFDAGALGAGLPLRAINMFPGTKIVLKRAAQQGLVNAQDLEPLDDVCSLAKRQVVDCCVLVLDRPAALIVEGLALTGASAGALGLARWSLEALMAPDEDAARQPTPPQVTRAAGDAG